MSSEVDEGLMALSQAPSPECSGQVIRSSLRTLRRHLGMEVGFVGRFEAGCRLFDYVDAQAQSCPVRVGDRDRTEETYCGRIAEGLVPGLIPDASAEPGVADLDITERLGIGAYMSVPLHRRNGQLLGTICCFSSEPDHSLRERDLGLMRLFAELVSAHMETMLLHEERIGQVRSTVRRAIDQGGPAIVLQPVVDLGSGKTLGFEALSRFDEVVPGVGWDTAQWFAEAHRAGIGPELETIAVANALALLPRLPGDAVLGVNVSESTLHHAPLVELLVGAPRGRLVVEITEQVQVVSYLRLTGPLHALRDAGVRIAVDDAGSGYAGLLHILELAPEIVKLDRSLGAGVSKDPARQAMIRAIVTFADNQSIELVAEGVEESVDADALRHLGVRLGQGYYFGRPASLVD